MTLFEKIKSMSIDEIAEKAVKHMKISILANGFEMSMIDGTCFDTKEKAIAHNKKILEKKYTEDSDNEMPL